MTIIGQSIIPVPTAGPAPSQPARRRRGLVPAGVGKNPPPAATDAALGAATIQRADRSGSRTAETLPFRFRARVRVSGVMLPIVGAALGALLLGLPGAIIGGVAGWLLARS